MSLLGRVVGRCSVWRRLLLLLLLLVGSLINSSDAFVDCEFCSTALSRTVCRSCWFQCALRYEHAERTADAFDAQLFGQPQVCTLITKALRRHENDSGGGPLALHFAGDNGVGKTLTARLMAESRFVFRDSAGELEGLLYLRGEEYRGDAPDDVARFRADLRRRVVRALRRCPQALVVLDEVEKVHRTTVAALQDFLDGTHPVVTYGDVKVRTDRAVFVFISDFGSADATAGLLLPELTAAIERTSRHIWQRKAVDVVDVIVPFRPLDASALYHIAAGRVARLSDERVLRDAHVRRVDASSAVLDALVADVQRHHSGMNGRGVDRVFNSKVLDVVIDAVDKLSAKRASASRAVADSTSWIAWLTGRSSSSADVQLLQQTMQQLYAPHRIEIRLTKTAERLGTFAVEAESFPLLEAVVAEQPPATTTTATPAEKTSL